MAVQRNLWELPFWAWPQLPCPSCDVGTLKIDNNSISNIETRSSEAARSHEDWEPNWIVERFIAILTCTNPSCKDNVFACGKITKNLDYYPDHDGISGTQLDDDYFPRFFEPPPPVFPIPSKCPKKVRSELVRAFALIWSDVDSAGNRLRVAVEALMNECKIQKKAKIKAERNKGKFRDLTLDDRIKKFGEKQDEAATHLMAIKWLGNTGSHTGLAVLTRDDLLDAFEHFEHALDLIYLKNSADLMKRAKHINELKGPIRAKSKLKGRLRRQ